MHYLLLLGVFGLCLKMSNVYSAEHVITVDENFLQVNLREHVRALRIESNKQLSEVQTIQSWPDALTTDPLEQQKSLWSNFKVRHISNSSGSYSLSIGNPSLNIVDVFILDDKNRILQSFLVGAKRDILDRPFNHRDFILPLDLESGQEIEVFVRITDDGPMMFTLDLWRNSALIAYEQKQLAFIGVLSGALAILFCYFLITYVLLRSPIRFWFAISSASLLLLFLNIDGIVSQVVSLGAYVSSATTCIVALLIFAAAKVSHSMLVKVPIYWRYMAYTLAIALLVSVFTLNAYWQIIAIISLAGAAVLLQVLLALLFHNRNNSMPNRVFALGWVIIGATALIDVALYLTGILLATDLDLVLSFVIMTGVLLIAVAIEAHEQVTTEAYHQTQQDAIANLRQFYDLFRNSAEGLYTSTTQGKLITTNPAMCALFGYENEQQMLDEVSNTSQFYANGSDRELLLGQIYEQGVVLGKEIKGLRRDGTEFWFSISTQIREEEGEKYLFGSIFDITEKKQSSISLEYLATHDSLTGVYNRREFELRLHSSLLQAKQQKTELTLLFMDLDQFKVVNDTCGHKAGDVLIKQLSQQLNDVVIKKGILARLGGDEFGVLLEEQNAQMAYLLANQLLNVVQEFRFIWENRIFSLGVSIGLVPWNEKIDSPEQLLSMADAACYMAKEHGRNQVHTYSPQDKNMQRYESEIEWVSHINDALRDDKFELFYQHYHPLTKMANGHHYELLLRLRDVDAKIVPPASFLPSAERYNLTAQLDRWVVEHYFKWLSDKQQHKDDLVMANINLSGHSLADKELKLFVLNAFEKYSIPYQKICFEITESMAILKMDETLNFINTFRQLGCSFALDDFGSGFSSYNYLKNLPVNYVKIDGSFVKDLLVDNIDMAMVSSINDVAKAMGMETVAEFVESKEIMVELGKMGVDFAQGYGVARPSPLFDFSAYKA
jgi:diguanylate cyclase (GGDEF)-like protein/PAS domain S-box-containing protein